MYACHVTHVLARVRVVRVLSHAAIFWANTLITPGLQAGKLAHAGTASSGTSTCVVLQYATIDNTSGGAVAVATTWLSLAQHAFVVYRRDIHGILLLGLHRSLVLRLQYRWYAIAIPTRVHSSSTRVRTRVASMLPVYHAIAIHRYSSTHVYTCTMPLQERPHCEYTR